MTDREGLAALYAQQLGREALSRQEAEARERYACCGEPRVEGHHRSCGNWKPPAVEGQGSLL